MNKILKNEENEGQNKGFLTYEEMMVLYANTPKPQFLWNGIKEKTFGLIFGPSKSGKTIFCENFAMSIATGAKDFFGYELCGIPRKVLFMGLEEDWRNRAERNSKQVECLDDSQKDLIKTNFRYQPIDFAKSVLSTKNWEDLEYSIIQSEAEVVFIDSVTRMSAGEIEDSTKAGKMMLQLRELCYQNNITLICIHHTPKMIDQAITLDKIKGSAVIAQEIDFAIGVNCTSRKNRYIKNVAFRYASDDDEIVKEFTIGDDIWLNYEDDVDEYQLLERTDGRRNDNWSSKIINFLSENKTQTYSTSELTEYFTSTFNVSERTIKSNLKECVQRNKIFKPEHGKYCFENKKLK